MLPAVTLPPALKAAKPDAFGSVVARVRPTSTAPTETFASDWIVKPLPINKLPVITDPPALVTIPSGAVIAPEVKLCAVAARTKAALRLPLILIAPAERNALMLLGGVPAMTALTL